MKDDVEVSGEAKFVTRCFMVRKKINRSRTMEGMKFAVVGTTDRTHPRAKNTKRDTAPKRAKDNHGREEK